MSCYVPEMLVQQQLKLAVSVTPPSWRYRQDKVELSVALTNLTTKPMSLLVGTTGAEHFFFRIHLMDESGQMIMDGTSPLFMDTDDLPMGTFHKLEPHTAYTAVLDWRYLYNVRPGGYQLSVVYMVQPVMEPHGAGLYSTEIQETHSFVGTVMSEAVAVTSMQ